MAKIFHHNDNDGRLAAFWILQHLQQSEDVELIEMHYNKPFPFNSIKKGEAVFIVDYHIGPEEMKRLLDITEDVVMIDHHGTAIKKYEGWDDERPVLIMNNDYSGCVLACMYFMEPALLSYKNDDARLEDIYKEVPRFTKLVGDYDTWAFQYGQDSLFFYYGSLIYDTAPRSSFWGSLAELADTEDEHTSCEKIVSQGKLVGRYRDNEARRYLKSWAFETEFEGYNCIAVNAAQVGSKFFDAEPGCKKYDIYISFVFDGKKWNLSFYSETVDVGKIAVKHGGGGHRGASGCVCDKLPFVPKEKE